MMANLEIVYIWVNFMFLWKRVKDVPVCHYTEAKQHSNVQQSQTFVLSSLNLFNPEFIYIL